MGLLSRLTLLFAVLSLVLSPLAEAAPKKKKAKRAADGAKRVSLVIWGGGKTPADAEKAAKDFTDRGFESSAPVVKLFSTEVRGLNPGFHIAVLGACSPAHGQALLRRARQFYPGVYVRSVPAEGKVASLPCPRVTTPRREWYYEPSPDEPAEITGSEELVLPSGTLKVEVAASVESNSEFVAASYAAKATLTKGDKELDAWNHDQPDFATVVDLALDGNAIVLTTRDAISDCKFDTFAEVNHVERRITVKKGRIDVAEEIVGRESGLCGPQYEGSDPCSIAKQSALYDAVRGACDNASREACDKAIAEYESTAEEVDCSEWMGGAE